MNNIQDLIKTRKSDKYNNNFFDNDILVFISTTINC